MRERRILITHLVGEAFIEEFGAEKFDNSRLSAFLKCGLAATVDKQCENWPEAVGVDKARNVRMYYFGAFVREGGGGGP